MRINFAQGDVMRIPMADESVHCAILSPPYWKLRSYETGENKKLELGAEPLHDCSGAFTSNSCGECFVCHARQYFAEIWRVLRNDGICWLNLGDCYSGSGGAGGDYNKGGLKEGQPKYSGRSASSLKPKDLAGIPWRTALALQADGWTLRQAPPWIKSNPMPESTKDRPNTAHEYWFMLTKGKRVYSDMESVKQESTDQKGRAAGFIRENAGPDVPGQQAKQHRKNRKEHIPGKYYSDMEAVRVGYDKPLDRWGGETKKTTDNLKGEENPYQLAHRERDMRPNKAGRHWRTNDFMRVALENKINNLSSYIDHLEKIKDGGGILFDEDGKPEAMFFNTKGYGGAHFATFNSDMIEPLIKFSTSEKGVCPKCGNPWVRIVEKGYRAPVDETKIAEMEAKGVPRQKANLYGHNTREPHLYAEDPDKTVGWEPTCDCKTVTAGWELGCECEALEPVPATVFDPFSGSGTTVMVASQLGRTGVGLELSMEYIELSRERTGMRALQAWESGRRADSGGLEGLPMFEELE